jgi:GTP1/Obg family GTP-binding protein
MKKKIIDKIDLVIEDIINIQELIDFDTSDSSEYDLDSVVNLLAEIRGKVNNEIEEVEKIDLKDL